MVGSPRPCARAQCAFDSTGELLRRTSPFSDDVGGLHGLWRLSDDHDEIDARWEQLAESTKCLAYQALCPIARYGAADLSRGRDAEPCRALIGTPGHHEHERARRDPRATLLNASELRALSDARRSVHF
jgi:hypothetical protein